MKLPEAVATAGGAPEQIAEATTALELQKDAIEANTAAQGKYKVAATQAGKAKKEFDSVTAAIEVQQAKIDKLTLEIGEMKKEVSTEALEKAFSTAGVEGFTAEMLKSKEGIKELRDKLNELDDKQLKLLKQSLQGMGFSADQAQDYVDQLRGGLRGIETEADSIKRAANEIDNLKNSVLHFFSLTNTVQLFKRAVTHALNTVKELDATMTEAAVVTEFDVGDMWSKLPQYSKEAQKLGVSINGMYQATTLYYQQGLKTNEAMQLGIETMKMAKIAGMESAEATEAMTAALRGFNMELNETSATRVNDVYSQLAAVTAADTEQIATAMSKTASIAASANMEFETTAALLSQIIETTQEAPETAGTAMKTIIARFSEVKSLREQGQSTGKDEEGEEIDVNKIQKALRTVGISMEGFFAGTEGLDSILLKLAEKWEGLDFETQRYIATMAAGSRQQSRFIAMMSDYGRTQELVSAANNSAGASQTQFNKTLDSMESKLQKMNNAWDEFLMGLANNEILKGAIDTITFIIEGINNMTEALSGGNGLIKSIISLTTVVGALKLGKMALGSAFGFIGASMGIGGGAAGVGGSTGTSNQPNAVQQMTGPNLQQQGEIEGQKAATGFRAGWNRAMAAGKNGAGVGGRALAFFNSDDIKAEKNTRKANNAEGLGITGIRKDAVKAAKKGGADAGRDTALGSLRSRNSGKSKEIKVAGKTETYTAPILKDEQWDEVGKTYDDVYAKTNNVATATEAASNKVREFGGTALDASEKEALLNEQAKTTGFDMAALGGAVMGVGTALGGLSMLFSSLGMDEAAEDVSKISAIFMGLGMVMSVMPAIAKALGMSFTKAGVQISVAGWSGQLAWWWVVLIVAAVALLVVGVIALAKAMEAASDEAQLEKMNEQIENLGAAADEAKDKFDDLKGSFEDLEEHKKTLKDLTKGTREWREALIKNNQAVLDLVNNYPELAQYMSRGENGELMISEEGQNKVLDQQFSAYISASNAQTALMQQRDEKQLDMDAEAKFGEATGTTNRMNFAEKTDAITDNGWATAGTIAGATAAGAAVGAIFGPIGAAIGGVIGLLGSAITLATAPSEEEVEEEQTGGLRHDEFNKLAAEMQARGIDKNDKEGIQQIMDDLNLTLANGYSIDTLMSSIDNLGPAFDELANSAYALQMAEEARVDAIAANVAASSEVVQNSEHGRVAEESGGQAFTDYSDRVEDTAKTYADKLDVKDKNLDSDEDARKVLKDYAETQGLTEAEVRKKIEDGELDRETIARTLAARDTDAKMKKAMENTVKVMEKVEQNKSQDEINTFKTLMTDRGEGMSIGAKEMIEKMGMEKYIKSMGITEDDAISMGYASLNEYIDAMNTNYERGATTFEKATMDFQRIGISLSELPDELTAGMAQGLANKLSAVAATQGTEMAREVLGAYGEITKNMDPEEVELFTTYMNDIDWSDADQIREFQEQMAAAGMNIPVDQLEDFTDLMIEAGNATRKLTFEEAIENIKQIQSILSDMETGELERTFSKDQYEALVKVDPTLKEDFIQDLDGSWIYVGESIDSLSAALKENTAALLGKTNAQYAAKAGIGSVLELDYSGTGYDYERLSTNQHYLEQIKNGKITGSFSNKYLQHFIDTAVERGVKLEDLGVEGLTSGTDVTQLSDEVKSRIAGELLEIGANSGFYQSKINAYNATTQFAANRNEQSGMILATDPSNNLNKYGNQHKNYWHQTTLEVIKAIAQPHPSWLTEERYASNIYGDTDHTDDYDIALGVYLKSLVEQYAADGKDVSELGIDNFTNATDFSKLSSEQLMQIAKDIANATEVSEANTDVLMAQAAQYGVSEGIISNFSKAMQGTSEAEKEAAAATISNAISQKRSEQAYGRALKKMNAVADEYGDLAEGADGYTEMIYAYGEALNIDMNLENYQFLSEHMNLVKQAAEGNIEAIQELNRLLAEKHGLTITADGNFDGYIDQVIAAGSTTDEFIEKQLEAGAYELVTIQAEQDVKYLVPTEDGGWKYETFETGAMIQTLKPKSAESIARAQKSGGVKTDDGGGGSAEEYKNPYDKLHDTLKQINDTIREREKLERRYQSLLDRQLLTLKEARELYNRTMDSYQTEAGYQRYIIQERYQQIEDEVKANPGMEKYVQIVDDGYGGKSIRIDWEAFEEKVGSEWEEGEDVSAFYDNIKEWLDGIYEAEETLDDIADGMWELINRGKDQYLDLEDQIIKALVNERQKEIDKLSDINNSINSTNSEILKSLQEQVNEYRQNRKNEKTEEELSDKQRRLAYLQQDTSGANQLKILQLQEEIDKAAEDYTDTLIDQKISELQKQNDQAAEQRQRQIDIMQAQLDYDQETGAFNAKAEQLIEEVRANHGILSGTELESLLQKDANWEGMSRLDKVKWLDDLSKMLAEALEYRDKTPTISDLMEAGKLKEGQKIKFKTADGKEVEGTVQADGTIKDKDGNVYSGVTRDWLGNYSTTENYAEGAPVQPPEPEAPKKPELTTNDKKGVSAAIWNGGYGWGSGETRTKRLKEVFGDNDIQKNYVNKGVMSGYSGKVSDYSYDNMKKKFTAYKTGGLADFTGPAWLDGTKSKPEYILNADQTKAFFTLVDVLSGLRDSKTSTTQNSGDSIYDIDINVESIGSDYDVDQLADRVKSLINEDARYRNNNTISLMR